MAKFTVYQIKRSERALASRALFYGISDSFTQADARNAFSSGDYVKTADVEAENLQEVTSIINNDRGSAKLVRTGPLRNIAIGDLIHNADTDVYFIATTNAYERIKIRR